jgi:predicted permease
MIRPLPYPESDRLYTVWTNNRERGWTQVSYSVPDFVDLREQSRTISVAATSGASFNLSEGDRPERLTGARVTANFFQVLGIQPAEGRGFLPDEEIEGQHQVVVITDGLWQRRFGGDPGILGSTVLLNGAPYTVVGVMPPKFWYRSPGNDILVPFPISGTEARNSHYVGVLARLNAGFSEEQARDEAERIATQLAREYPETNAGNGAALITLHDDIFNEGFETGSLISSIAVLFVLLIACANVANLLLTHAAGRDREVAVRTALGANRARIVRQFLTEALILSVAGAALGVGLSVFGIRGLISVMPPWFPRVDEIGLNGRVLWFTLLAAVVSAILVGLAPAIQGARANTVDSLKEGGRGGTAVRGGRLRKALVVGEVSLALALVVCSVLLVQGFVNVRLADRGFDETDVLTFRVALPAASYPDTASLVDFHTQLGQRLQALSGVGSVGATTILPTEGNSSTSYALPGEDIESELTRKVTSIRDVTPGYFEALDIPVLRGRGIEDRDRADGRRVIVINEAMAERHWPDVDPVGRELIFYSGHKEIVGVVANTNDQGSQLGDRPMVFFSAYQDDNRGMSWVVESDMPIETLAGAVRAEVLSLDPNLPAYNVRTFSEVIDESLGGDTIMAKIMSVVAIVALVLALAGVYGVMAYSVSQRRQEMGVRMALGAQNRDVLGMVLRQGSVLAAIGVVLGLAVAFGMARGLSFFLYGVSAFEPVTYGLVAAALLLSAVVATFFPARSATKVDPVVALRAE